MIPLYSDAPPVVQIESQREIAPFSESRDAIDDAIKVMDMTYVLTNCARSAFLKGVERLRDELAPSVHVPRRSSVRVSQKAKRRAMRALDQLIAQGRAISEGRAKF
jgi:hypothetical protein